MKIGMPPVAAVPFKQQNIIANYVFDNCYRDAVDMFTHGSYTIVTGNVIRNLVTTGLDIKTIYRDPPYTGGTSIAGVRQISRVLCGSE